MAVPIVFGIIFIAGLIGNGCVITAVLTHKSMWNAPNMFIGNNMSSTCCQFKSVSLPTLSHHFRYADLIYIVTTLASQLLRLHMQMSSNNTSD